MSQSTRRYKTESARSTASTRSDESEDSQSTAPTSLYRSPAPSLHYGSMEPPIYSKRHHDISPATKHVPRSSTETYSSTVESLEEFTEEPDSYDSEYRVLEDREVLNTNVRPSSPSDFAEYFPTVKRLHICHDDTTRDGNMNLRVDIDGRNKEKIQLFYLRMQDIKKRDFSLRRYERSSGREVCKSSRKYQEPPVAKRPATISRSVSNALATFKKPDFKRASSALSTYSTGNNKNKPLRQDSGYGSDGEDDYFENYLKKAAAAKIPTNTTKLEFSNYAQVEVKRRGAKSSKRYEFEYWGSGYAWKRVVNKDGAGKEISFHLYKGDSGPAVARIVPDLLNLTQIREEARNGAWVPPCSLWIHDQRIMEALTDVADVVVATGLIALVDDCIKRCFSKKIHTPSSTPLRAEMGSPKSMMDHVFKRRNSGGSTKSEREQRSSPLRYANAVAAY